MISGANNMFRIKSKNENSTANMGISLRMSSPIFAELNIYDLLTNEYTYAICQHFLLVSS